jgi:preprotein translocase subunit SecD
MKKSAILTLACVLASAAVALASSTPPIFQMRLVLDALAGDSEPMIEVTHNQNATFTNVLNVQKVVLLDQTALKSVKPVTDGLGQPVIEITLTDAGAKQFAEITRQNLHRRLAIIIDGQLCEPPVIQTEISGGKAQISGKFTKQETIDLAKKVSDVLTKT